MLPMDVRIEVYQGLELNKGPTQQRIIISAYRFGF
jgi:hypothetical protein